MQLDLLQLSAALALLLLASLGAHAGAGLLAYFPGRLEKLLGDQVNRSRTLHRLNLEDLELRLGARVLMLGGAAGGLWLLHASAGPSQAPWLLLLGCLFLALFVIALPASSANAAPERLVLWTTPVLRPICQLLRWPLLRPLQTLSGPLLKLGNLRPRATESEAQGVSAADVHRALTEIAGSGGLPREQEAWIANVVQLRQLTAEAVMTPRTEIRAIDAATPLREAIRQAAEAGLSRIPVYKDRLDRVVGMFYAKDILQRLNRGLEIERIPVGEVCREPLFVAARMNMPDLLREFRGKKVQIAIVLDEFGGTDGLITIEDVLEEIVGDISDEYDDEGDGAAITDLEGGRVFEIFGRTRVEEANAALGEDLVPASPNYDTVGGYLLEQLGEVPSPGTRFEGPGLSYQVLHSDGRRILRLRLTRTPTAPVEGI